MSWKFIAQGFGAEGVKGLRLRVLGFGASGFLGLGP